MKEALVLGAGGFIGSHMCKRLKSDGFKVYGCDVKLPEYDISACDDFFIEDLTNKSGFSVILDRSFDEIYQFAADMGGAGYIFTEENDASIAYNSVQINLNLLKLAVEKGLTSRIFFSSSACVYPQENQTSSDTFTLAEGTAIPANPDSVYGWEKLFSERLYLTFRKNHGLETKIGRYHNIYGEMGTWRGGREKAPAAMCRKVAVAKRDGTKVEIWGDGKQTRSFLYIEDCLDATTLLMRSPYNMPLNIGSEENISINQLALLIADIAQTRITIENIDGPQGVRGRSSDNRLIESTLGWRPKFSLRSGLTNTYD